MPLSSLRQRQRQRQPQKTEEERMSAFSPLVSLFLLLLLVASTGGHCHGFQFEEATIESIHRAFDNGRLTSRQLVEYYLAQIRRLNPLLRGVIEVSPDALRQADRADRERTNGGPRGGLHGVPILLKDNIATLGPLNTTAGSFALLGSVVPRDAGVARRLGRAGAVILGKASLSEWANYRGNVPNGWCARSGQGRNPYNLSADTCGSSSGSAISAAANMAAVTLGTETDGSIICPSAQNSVVGIKPTVGLTSRAGVIPITPRQDSVGPMCRTVSDAVEVLDAIAGYDPRDNATMEAMKFIPQGGYKQFLKIEGLKGKRLGILRKDFFDFPAGSIEARAFEEHFNKMRKKGAILIDNLRIPKMADINNYGRSAETVATSAEFKLALNSYLSELSYSPVRSLADVIAFNNKHKIEEKIDEYGQSVFLMAQNTSGIGSIQSLAIAYMKELSKKGLERLMMDKKLDAIVTAATIEKLVSNVLAIGGYPGITVPAGYSKYGVPFGICFAGLRGSEPKLIEISYAFEQATLVRKPPSLDHEK